MTNNQTPKYSKARAIAVTAVFVIVIFGLTIANFVITPPEISRSERRRLASFKTPTWERILDASWMKEFDEDYTLDSFPFRDSLRALKANFQFNVMGQSDNNDIYIVNGHAAKIERLNEGSVEAAANKFNKLIAKLPDSANVYYSIIPDKSMYLAENHPQINHGRLLEIMREKMNGATYIDLYSVLSADSYYTTDLHWEQSKLIPVAETLCSGMGVEISGEGYTVNTLEPFYGVYSGQSALSLDADKLHYLTGGAIDGAVVKLLDTNTLEMADSSMYVTEKFSGIDPYDVFLSGAQPLITIENPNSTSDRELIIFRDSYSSSLAPLLAEGYAKITLIDLRYLASPMVEQLVEFSEECDVLFLYGTLVLNSSGVLLVM
ncbi:MAG: hypothetical protein J6I45_03175 [Clostridia bacterium]|nr:hypothetical protein [Clostridia bacterium]